MNPFMQRKLSDLFIMLDLQEFLLFYRQLQKFAATEGKTPHSVHLMRKVQDVLLEKDRDGYVYIITYVTF